MGHGAQIVGSDRHAQRGAGGEQRPGQRFEVAIALALVLKDRDRPSVLAGLDELVVPICALDEPDRQRRRALPGPGPLQDRRQVRGRLAQIGLQDDAGRRTVPELGLAEQLQDELQDGLAGVQRLHVDVEMRAAGVRGPQQRAQPGGGIALAAGRRVGPQQRGERRDLDADVGARQRTAAVGLQRGARRPVPGGGGDRVDRVQAAGGVAIGLGLGDGRLAEQVDRAGHRALPQPAQRRKRGPRALADDEAVGEMPDAAGGRPAEGDAPRPGVRDLHRRGERRRRLGELVKEAGQMAGEVVERPAGRGDVDEPEQRGPQLAIAGGELHGAGVERAQRLAGV